MNTVYVYPRWHIARFISARILVAWRVLRGLPTGYNVGVKLERSAGGMILRPNTKSARWFFGDGATVVEVSGNTDHPIPLLITEWDMACTDHASYYFIREETHGC